MFWCFTWRCFLSLRLKCDCVVYKAGFLISHVKKENKRFGDRSNRLFKDRSDQRIICKPADYAHGPTNEEWDRLCLSAPHAQSHHFPLGTSLYGYLISTDSWLCPWGKKILTLSMVPSVSVLLKYGFYTPTMNSQEYPPDTILTMSLDLNFSPWEKKGLLTARIKKKCFGYVLIEKPLAENIIKVNNLCPL